MSNVIVKKSKLKGNLSLPASKSFTHRALLCAALSRSKSVVSNISLSDDTNATISCLEALGCKILIEDNRAYVNSTEFAFKNEEVITLNCRESATTLRLLIPICAALGLKVKFIGEKTLVDRPLSIYKEILPLHGVEVSYNDSLPFEILGYQEEGPGTLKNGVFEVPGDISSQFISGLLFATALIRGESKIILTTELESKGYVDLSIGVLEKYNIKINKTEQGYQVRGNQRFLSSHVHVESDSTIAGLYLVANKLGANILLNEYSNEKLENIINSFRLDTNNEIDGRNIPDLVPVICVLAAYSNGRTKIQNVKRLKYKESDRIISCCDMINSLGGEAKHSNDTIIIEGIGELFGGKVNSYQDHRIIMAATIAGLFSDNKVEISDYECVSKSYKEFFDDIISIGGEVEYVNMG